MYTALFYRAYMQNNKKKEFIIHAITSIISNNKTDNKLYLNSITSKNLDKTINKIILNMYTALFYRAYMQNNKRKKREIRFLERGKEREIGRESRRDGEILFRQ